MLDVTDTGGKLIDTASDEMMSDSRHGAISFRNWTEEAGESVPAKRTKER